MDFITSVNAAAYMRHPSLSVSSVFGWAVSGGLLLSFLRLGAWFLRTLFFFAPVRFGGFIDASFLWIIQERSKFTATDNHFHM